MQYEITNIYKLDRKLYGTIVDGDGLEVFQGLLSTCLEHLKDWL